MTAYPDDRPTSDRGHVELRPSPAGRPDWSAWEREVTRLMERIEGTLDKLPGRAEL